jgi:hypothetical protein
MKRYYVWMEDLSIHPNDNYDAVVLADEADAACRERDEEIERLRKAIHEHRNNVWGEGGGIYHDEDMKLYAALADTEEGS